jgi:uncharacterized iron-regulated protein
VLHVATIVAIELIQLTGPDHQVIEINPQTIASVRSVRDPEHFARGTHCILFTTDGKNITVVETCARVHELLGQAK